MSQMYMECIINGYIVIIILYSIISKNKVAATFKMATTIY